jgi:membrane dipeptidase
LTKNILSRRRLLHAGVGAASAAVAFPMVNFGQYRVFAETPKTYSARAIKVVQETLTIDMLAPIKLDFRPEAFALPFSEKDKADYRASSLNVVHNSVGIGGPQAYDEALQFIAAWSGFVGRNSDLFTLVGQASDMDRAKANKKVAVIIGLQNAEQFREAKDVKDFYQLGLRCAQLTYNSQNMIGSGSTDREDGGVSDFGVEIINAMNDVGMLIDVSHSGPKTTLDAIELSKGPIAITHSNCRALVNHPRVKTDEAIINCAKKGGVMGITGVRMFVSEKEPTTIENMVDHIDHVKQIAGIEHVGIGTDYDLWGYDDMPADQNKMLRSSYKASYAFREKLDTDGYDHPRKLFDLAEVLIKRGYTDQQIQLVLGGNFRRLLGQVWK